ncbi:MAG: hypothetical protein GWP69_11370 [Gammaproteobacteria bacterium]|nr:hypothetical protein [Gammaproteobacteria bacterium]
MIRTPTFFAPILLALSWSVPALEVVEEEGFYIYFPKQETQLAAGLFEQLPDMLAFLADKGLPVRQPLHIVLDDLRDLPEVKVHVIPHKEIRIPLRAPGVLEDGYTEADPWAYFMFRGLCLQGIFGLRSGIPGLLYKGFGEIVSPNLVLPPWVDDGVCSLLYSLYQGKGIQDPFRASIFNTAPVPNLDIISHHPQIWPGYHAYHIYGRPFTQWLYQWYGWNKILEFLQVHGGGVVPFEIDLKASDVFGSTGAALWREFQADNERTDDAPAGLLISGYWSAPMVYWNNAGVFPGKLRIGRRGRYGYVDTAGTLWISEYAATSYIYRYANNVESSIELHSLWDPGPGRVAVGRRGHRSWLVIFPDDGVGGLRRTRKADIDAIEKIPAPAGVIQLSGPVRNERGHIAVAANVGGNWDIWVHDGKWHRVTDTPSIELDPWWEGETLVWASNATGSFQIHQADHQPITSAAHGALLPRAGNYLELTANGWRILDYEPALPDLPPLEYLSEKDSVEVDVIPAITTQAYDPFKSLWPNYIQPDIFAAIGALQLGVDTNSRDVTGDYIFSAGFRYSFESDFLALQGLIQRKTIGARYSRYPFGYETALGQSVSEKRNDLAVFWSPFRSERVEHADVLTATTGSGQVFDNVDVSLNWRLFSPLDGDGSTQDETWVSFAASKSFESLRTWGNVDLFTENRQSLSGGVAFLFGDQILTSLQFIGGKSWGEPTIGHTTFRIGGDLTEGYFTRRSTRVFPVRGFESSVIEAPTAAAASAEVLWPLANLQFGYASLPVFLHRLRLGTFVDAGYASVSNRSDDFLVGAGFEFLTSLEMGWGSVSTFRIGIAWPLVQPDGLGQEGPVVLFQLGSPL